MFNVDYRPLALTKGLELKARLMVKDEQVPNMWNMDKENSLVIVSFEGVDVIARRDCEDDIVSVSNITPPSLIIGGGYQILP